MDLALQVLLHGIIWFGAIWIGIGVGASVIQSLKNKAS